MVKKSAGQNATLCAGGLEQNPLVTQTLAPFHEGESLPPRPLSKGLVVL